MVLNRWRQAAAAMAVLVLLAGSGSLETVVAQDAAAPVTALVVKGNGFLLDGKPFRIVSGEMEYARIPRADWRDRLRKARAMGLNAVTVYVFWNLHEPRPGVYDFSGQNDVAEFLREAHEEGLYVVLRPGPYVCAEWDLGGFPSWLLKDHTMVLRSLQPQFMEATTRWMKRLGQELAPLQASQGGPIIAVQVENEYGSFGDDQAYMRQIHQLLLDSGFTSSLLYTADGAAEEARGSLPDLFASVDFGTGDAARDTALMRKFRPDGPLYVAEYWDGWYDQWGQEHQVRDAAAQEAEIRSMLEAGDSISLYMVHGGTSFGWMNGANSHGVGYRPDVNSYDYDAPLDESGRPRPKYFRLRDIIAEATGETPPAVPESPALITLPPIELKQSRSLWDMLPVPVASNTPLSMEDLDQAYGYILYRTEVDGSGSGKLVFDELHSYARVYVDGKLQGVADRRLDQKSVAITVRGRHCLDILVENSGRVNFTTVIRGERAGILGNVSFAGKSLTGWKNYPLPFAPPPVNGFHDAPCSGPCLYRAEFTVEKSGDTFLNTEKLGKGVVWVNGHLLGRFWNIGPMGDLYLPGVWLRAGKNEITVLDLNGGGGLSVEDQDHQTYVQPKPESQIPSTEATQR